MNYNDLKRGIKHNTIEQTNDKTSLSTTINPKTPLTKINLSMNHSTGFNSGEIVPVYHNELLPGDTFDIDANILIRGSMPKASTWEVALMECTTIFVPNRYIWPEWVNFMGEIKELGNPSKQPKTVPIFDTLSIDTARVGDHLWPLEGDLASYLGIPVGAIRINKKTSGRETLFYKIKEPINSLAYQGYFKCYNDWYRAEYFQDPVQFPAGIVGNTNGPNVKLNISDSSVVRPTWTPNIPLNGTGTLRSCKLDDLFTLALPFTAIGGDVPLGILDLSKLQLKQIPIVQNPEAEYGITLSGRQYDGSPARDMWVTTNGTGALAGNVNGSSPTGSGTDLYFRLATDEAVDVFTNPTGAQVVSVNELRQSISIQHYEEINARSGTKYIEMLRGHFGIANPSVEFGMSEIVGSFTVDLSTQNVIQTSSTVTNSPLGTVGGISMNSGHMPHISYTAKEHGQLYILITVRPVMNYPYGLPKKFSKIEKLDYYFPSFDRVGEVPILKKEIYFRDGSLHNDKTFGYQIAHYDYKYSMNQMSGPFAPEATNSIGKLYKYYERITTPPSLNSNFLVTSPSTIGDTMLINDHAMLEFGAFQYVAQFNFNISAIRPMSFNPPPGLNRV